MKGVFKLARRFVGVLLLSVPLLLLLNLFLLGLLASRQASNAEPWTAAQEAADALQPASGGYVLPEEMGARLEREGIWAVLIDNHTLQAVWQTDNLPESIPVCYTAFGIAQLTRGYINSYPTFTGEAEDGLMVLGYPQGSYWKHLWPSWEQRTIASLPRLLLFVLIMNLLLIFLIYLSANQQLFKSIGPIIEGIQALGACMPVYIRQGGPLGEIALQINRTSERLQSQSYQLRRKETARANWIAGVSHDIRTPLSMVMGYASQLEADPQLSAQGRRRAAAICKQSERIKNLVSDLNLASKLEYTMQPLVKRPENMVALARQAVVDFLNMQEQMRYPIEWETEEGLAACMVYANKELVCRAVMNLLQNCMNHNEEGCTIYLSVTREAEQCIISVEDDGAGASRQQIESLNTAPHYMACDSSTFEQRHGLGLLIVRQIAASHGGKLVIGQSPHGGFSAKLVLPIQQEECQIQGL